MKFGTLIFAVFALTHSTLALGETARLKFSGDLMLHPQQIATYVDSITSTIRATNTWDWPAMNFTKPYKTSWTGVQARGPFDVHFDTSKLANQEIGFELNWTDPNLAIAQFQIDDTIRRDFGNAVVNIHLAGQCTGMTMSVPNGQWKVKGRLGWTWTTSGLQTRWLEFSFTQNASAIAQANLGNCVGPQGLPQALQEAFDGISRDNIWLEGVLRDGTLNWIETSLGQLQAELLKVRAFNIKPGMDLTWLPEGVMGMASGLVRVKGGFHLVRESKEKFEQNLDPSYSEGGLAAVKESGFVLPRELLPALSAFLFRTGDLQYRVQSSDVESFQGLMASRFLQFFVWPDLMNFSKKTQFYFDVASQKAPVLSQGGMRESGSGIKYRVQAPLMVRQWAPARKEYLPYVDFTSPMSGLVEASVQEQNLVVIVQPDELNISSEFRSEFAAYRQVNPWIATSLLGSRVRSYLSSKPMSIPLPEWSLGATQVIRARDVQLWKQSLRIPLEVRSNK